MNSLKAIRGLGLNESEANLYLAALELGESTISELATKSGLTRSSCYDGIKELISNGLLSVVRMGTKKIYRAENPDKLLLLLKEKEEMIASVLPQLKSRYGIRDRKPALYSYQGHEGFRAILNDILEKQYPLSAITSIDSALKVLGEDFKDFIEKRHKKNLRVRLLTNKTETSIELKKKDNSELRMTKFLSDESVLTTANFIYGDRIAIISLNAKNPFGLVIEDPAIVQTYMALFEIAWSHGF